MVEPMTTPRDSEALVRAYYDAFNRADWEGMLSCLADDVAHDINQGGREAGKERFRAFLGHMDRCYRERLEDLVVMVDATGRHVAAEFTVVGTYLETDGSFPPARGQEYRLPAGAFLAVADGKITRVSTHYNVRDWVRQVEVAA
jgi:steroid delta-isomerase-like uncharacterized protein